MKVIMISEAELERVFKETLMALKIDKYEPSNDPDVKGSLSFRTVNYYIYDLKSKIEKASI